MPTLASKPRAKIETFVFADDGSIPNNPTLPLVIYRGGIHLGGTPDPIDLVAATFKGNGWTDLWRNGIYPYVHYHSAIHEVLGLGRGRARVRFGGQGGTEIDLAAGDVAILPAGTAHQGIVSSGDLVIVGAYPQAGRFDVCYGSQIERRRALFSIPDVPLPDTDPVYGADGPLRTLWRPVRQPAEAAEAAEAGRRDAVVERDPADTAR